MVRNASAAGRLLAGTGVALFALVAPTVALAGIGDAGAPPVTVSLPDAPTASTAPIDAVVATVPTTVVPADAPVAPTPATPAPVAPVAVVPAAPVDGPSASPPVPAGEVAVQVVSKRIELTASAKPVAKAKPKPTAKTKANASPKAKVKRKAPAKSQTRVLMQASGTTVAQDIPIGMVISSCMGDTVPTTGQIHLVLHTITSDSGATHFTATSKWDKVTGTSLVTGKRFASDTVAMTEATINKGQEVTSVLSGHFIYAGETVGLGLGDDFFTHMIMHMTVSASGVPSATVNRLEGGCR